jgi:hypothetical protein
MLLKLCISPDTKHFTRSIWTRSLWIAHVTHVCIHTGRSPLAYVCGVTTVWDCTGQLCVFQHFNILKMTVRAINTWSGMLDYDLLCSRIPEDGTLVPKHVGVILTVNCVLWLVIDCILLCVFVSQYTVLLLYVIRGHWCKCNFPCSESILRLPANFPNSHGKKANALTYQIVSEL